MQIVMLGHAGMLVETSAGGIVLDPWLFGSAFNDSWELLEPSHNPPDLWDRARYIWFSHEHPDHFHPASVRSIPQDRRKDLTVLFQTTLDGKVKLFLEGLGFRVIEIDHGSNFDLGPGCRLYLETVGIYDSWIAIEDNGEVFLDLNDCAIVDFYLTRIRDRFPRIDAMMSQFSFAGWIGNREDHTRHQEEREKYLAKLAHQTETLRPTFVIPAASFICFSHADNEWMNACKATVTNAVDRITASGSLAVVLRPGDEWQIGAAHENTGAIQHYQQLASSRPTVTHCHPGVALSQIAEGAQSFAETLRERNNVLLLRIIRSCVGFLRPITFWIKDLHVAIEIDPLTGALREVGRTPSLALIHIHSFALKQLLTQPSGIDTLVVSGLFESADRRLDKLHNAFNINSLNNAGIELRFSKLFSPAVLRRLFRIALPWLAWKRASPAG